MEETLTGYVCTGGWGEIVEHGERITLALIESGANAGGYEDAFERWDDWRPKTHERLSADVSEKTAEHASIQEGVGEREGVNPDEDLKSAGNALSESVEKIENGDPQEAFERWQESVTRTARAADSSWRRIFRWFEEFVYKHLMTQVAPYYFDTELVSANITRVRSSERQYCYRFEVNINDDNLREEIDDHIHEYEDRVQRWHVATKKDTQTAEAAEGVEAPPEEPDEVLHTERNLSQNREDDEELEEG